MLFKIGAFLAKYNLFGVFLKNFYFIYISCNFIFPTNEVKLMQYFTSNAPFLV